MKKIFLLGNVRLDGDDCPANSIVDVTEEIADELVSAQCARIVEDVKDAKPDKK